jgi:hypothetical protein
MSQHNKAPTAQLTTVAEFPKNYFLENLAVGSDNSILITAMNHSELWYVPPADGDEQVAPMLLHKFDMLTMGIAEVEHDVFLMLACNFYTTHESALYKIDSEALAAGRADRAGALLQVSDRGSRGEWVLPAGVRRPARGRLLRKPHLARRLRSGRR